jgi:hypothetical protein
MRNRVKIAYVLNNQEFEYVALNVEAFRDLEHATRELQLELVAQVLALEPWIVTRENLS